MRGRFLLALSFLTLSEPLLSCPPEGVTVPSFGLASQSCGANGCSQTYTWAAPAGADSGTVYDLQMGSVADYCSFGALSYSVRTSTPNLTATVTGLPANVALGAFVSVQGCGTTSEFATRNDTFLTAPGKPVTSVQQTGTGQVTVTYSQPDARAGAILTIERSDNGGAFFELAFGSQPYANYCPAGSKQTFVDQNVPSGSYRYRAVGYGNAANDYGLIPGDPASVVVGGGACTLQCGANVPATAAAGQTVSLLGTATPASSCTGTTSFSWDFGDGSSSSLQNPQKAYVDPGTYRWSLNVKSGSGGSPATCVASGTITVSAAPCTVECSANVPSAGAVGQSVAFSGGATPSSSCTGSSGYAWDFGDGTTSVEKSPRKAYLSAGSYRWLLRVTAGAATCTASGTITISADCATPSAPSIGALPGSASSGRSISVSWSGTAASTLKYTLETSRDGFKTTEASQVSRSTSAVVTTKPSADDYTLSFRVKAVADCGSEGPYSAVKSLSLLKANAAFLLTKSNLTLTGVVGIPPTPGSVTFRNIGAVAGSLSVSPPPEGFVTVSPASLTLQPGAEGAFNVTPAASALTSEAFYQGLLGAGSESVPVSLFVQKGFYYVEGVVLEPSASTVVFSAPSGQNPAPQTITVNAFSEESAGPETVTLVPSIGPGGAWLSVGSSASGGVPPPISSGSPITLRVDRSRRSKEEGVSPLRTLIRFRGPYADSAVVEVIDNETSTVTGGAGEREGSSRQSGALLAAPPGGTSFIVSTAVKATSGLSGQVFTSDGWLRNLSGSATSADLFYTPDGKNGLVDPAVLKTTLSIPAGTTVRLSDLIGSLFRTSGTGQVEVRSSSPYDLSLRTRVDSVSGGKPETRYGGEVPTVAFGSGTYSAGPELVLPGIDDDAENRANLILTETTGAAVEVDVDVYDSVGAKVGATVPVSLAPYSKQQLDGLVNRAAPGRKLSGGWAGVKVRSGPGRVVAVATVIDNRSGSFSAIQGKGTSAVAAPRSALADAKVYVIPSAVRTIGQNNTQFLTSLSLVNGTATPARLTLAYRYVDQDDNGLTKSVEKSLTITGRGTFSKTQGADVIKSFFGVTNRSYGYFTIQGDVGKVVGTASIAAQVDPDDPSKGLRTAQVNGTFLDAPEVIGNGDVETRFAGAEKTVQKRTGLVLLELSGQPANVLVRMVSPTGTVVAERTVSVGSGQYFQINDVFGDEGVQLGDGPFQNMEVTAQVIDGTGRILAVATVNDNLSRNPEIFILKAPGPGDSTIGF